MREAATICPSPL